MERRRNKLMKNGKKAQATGVRRRCVERRERSGERDGVRRRDAVVASLVPRVTTRAVKKGSGVRHVPSYVSQARGRGRAVASRVGVVEATMKKKSRTREEARVQEVSAAYADRKKGYARVTEGRPEGGRTPRRERKERRHKVAVGNASAVSSRWA